MAQVQRPSSEIIESLRTTLRMIEEYFPSTEDQQHLAELKRVLLLRIADMEFVQAVVERETAEEPTAAEPISPISTAAEPELRIGDDGVTAA